MDPEPTSSPVPEPSTPAAVPPSVVGAPPPPPPYGAPAGLPPRPATATYPTGIGWLVAAVILFWPTALPALFASHRSARAAGAGDAPVAQREAATAKRWSVVSVCVGGALIVLSVVATIAWVVLVAVAFHDRGTVEIHHQFGPAHELPFDRHGGGAGKGTGGS